MVCDDNSGYTFGDGRLINACEHFDVLKVLTPAEPHLFFFFFVLKPSFVFFFFDVQLI